MRNAFLLYFALLLWIIAPAQKNIPAYGKAVMEELTMTSCEFDPGASAMKLLDLHEVEFELLNYGTKLTTEYRVRIKIFNEKGYKHATIRIPYFSKKGVARIKSLSAVIFNLDPKGKIVTQKLSNRDFFKDKAIENVGVVSFTFPHLQPGSVIEYSYKTVENNVLSISPWIIQGDIPVAHTSTSVLTPVVSHVAVKVFGADTIESYYELLKYDQFRRTTYFKNNVPSFQPEPYMSSDRDHKVKVVFMLVPRGSQFAFGNSRLVWQTAGRQLLHSRYFENQVGKIIPGTQALIDSARKFTAAADRIRFLYNAVQKKWAGPIEQTARSEDLIEAWDEGNATSAEINLILMNLLEKADIRCVPVLVSTRENGIINQHFPSFGQFNGIDIMAFDSTEYFLLDASIKNLSFRNPPFNIMNREVFVLSPDSLSWVTVVDDRPLVKHSTSIIADMNAEGIVEGTASIQYFDYSRAYRLDTTLNYTEKEEREIPGLKIISSNLDTTGQSDEPLFETIEFRYEPSTSGDFSFIDPQLMSNKNKNPFLRETRRTGIDLGCNQLYILTVQINLNGMFEVDHLPENVTIRAMDSSFSFKVVYSSADDKVYMSQLFEIRKAIFPREEYEGIKDFFKQMYTLMSKELVLKRKK